MKHDLYRFGSFVLDSKRRVLSRGGCAIPLNPKAFDLLAFLVQNPNRVIAKEELLKAVWADSVVEESNLTQNIFLLRKALSPGSEDSELIVTIPRKGYQFTADVISINAQAEGQSGATAQNSTSAGATTDKVTKQLAGEGQAAVGFARGRELPAAPPTFNIDRRPQKLPVVLVFAALIIAVAGYVSWRHFRFAGPQPMGKVMLAVLPFQNLTGDPDQEFFADGLTEELIAQIGRLHPEQLGVIARTSVMGYKNSKERLDQIGRELGVQYVIEGSFRRGPDRLRTTVQLIQVNDQSPLWTQDYDRPPTDILAVQDEIAIAVAREIHLRLSPQQQADLARLRKIDPEAHEAYLEGRFFWNKRTEEGFRKAITYFQAAVARDPNYPDAYAGLADAYLLLGGYGFEQQTEAMPKAKAAALKAIAIDNRLAEAYTSLGLISLQYDWNWVESERNFRRALELNPNYSTAHHYYGDGYLTAMGKLDDAVAELRIAHELDPLSLIITTDLAKRLCFAGQDAEAFGLFNKVVEAAPDFVQAHYYLAKAYELKGAYPEALAEAEKIKPPDAIPFGLSRQGQVYALQGRRREAIEVAQKLQQASKQRHIDPPFIADIYIALGDKDSAFFWLDKAYKNHSPDMLLLRTDPAYAPIRSDPRFADLVRRLGLPQ
jgi:TolB-like protein/DNA-binding winged helix-turn-helix (wHTH) protein